MTDEATKAADALGAAINGRDTAALETLYADDIVVWHASTNLEQGKSENIGLLRGVFKISSELEYVDIRRHLIDGGIVQQHTLAGTFDNGRPLSRLHACLVLKVRDGQITRIDEYFDSPAFAEVWERLAALTAA